MHFRRGLGPCTKNTVLGRLVLIDNLLQPRGAVRIKGARPGLTGLQSEGEWVSKSDMVAYLRCPYAFWLVDTGQIQFSETLSSNGPRLLAEGEAFEEAVLADTTPLPPNGLPQSHRQMECSPKFCSPRGA
jgi:hypothetical protein